MSKESKSVKIIIDTNVWISFLIGKNLKGLQNHLDSQRIKVVTCNEQLIELSEVFKKSKSISQRIKSRNFLNSLKSAPNVIQLPQFQTFVEMQRTITWFPSQLIPTLIF